MSDPASPADRRQPEGPAHLGLAWGKDSAPITSKHELDEEHLGSWPTLLLSKGSASARAWSRQGALQPSAALLRSKLEPLSPAPAAEAPGEACRSSAGPHDPAPSSSTPGAEQREKQYRAHRGFGDRRGGVISARTYFYASEAKCDQHMNTFLRCIDASGKCSTCPEQPHCAQGLQGLCSPHPAPGTSVPVWPALSLWLHPGDSSQDGFSAIKLTALGRPQFLVSARAVNRVRWGAGCGGCWGARLAAERAGHPQAVPCMRKTTLETLPRLLGIHEELRSLKVPGWGHGGSVLPGLAPAIGSGCPSGWV